MPDVAYDADPDTGVAAYGTYGFGGWTQVGGTSAASPQWAALMAITDQGLALNGESSLDGYTQTLPALYQLPSSDFHDITSGNNGYAAGPGFDLVTGLGSPVANKLVPDLIASVKPPVLTSIAVTPARIAIGDGSSFQFSATAYDQFGRPMVSQPIFTWSLASGGLNISSTGLYTAPSTGAGEDTVQATATVNNVTFSAQAIVNFQPGPALSNLQANPSPVTGTTSTLSGTMTDPSSALSYTWSVQNQPSGAQRQPSVPRPAAPSVPAAPSAPRSPFTRPAATSFS